MQAVCRDRDCVLNLTGGVLRERNALLCQLSRSWPWSSRARCEGLPGILLDRGTLFHTQATFSPPLQSPLSSFTLRTYRYNSRSAFLFLSTPSQHRLTPPPALLRVAHRSPSARLTLSRYNRYEERAVLLENQTTHHNPEATSPRRHQQHPPPPPVPPVPPVPPPLPPEKTAPHIRHLCRRPSTCA